MRNLEKKEQMFEHTQDSILGLKLCFKPTWSLTHWTRESSKWKLMYNSHRHFKTFSLLYFFYPIQSFEWNFHWLWKSRTVTWIRKCHHRLNPPKKWMLKCSFWLNCPFYLHFLIVWQVCFFSHVSTVFSFVTGNNLTLVAKEGRKHFRAHECIFMSWTRHLFQIPHFVSVVLLWLNHRIDVFLLIPKLGNDAVAARKTLQKNEVYSPINHIIGWYVTPQEKKNSATKATSGTALCIARESRRSMA